MPIIDVHAHIFPEKIALKAAQNIGDFYGIKMRHNGSCAALLDMGRRAGISRFVVHSVAVEPRQVSSINDYIAEAAGQNPQFIGFATLHPDMPGLKAELSRAQALGLRGVKLHPDFQKFQVDGLSAARLFALLEGRLPVIIHAGDMRYQYSNPARIAKVLDRFPYLDMIAAHFGGYSEWDEAYKHLAGRRVWVDTSSSLSMLNPERARELIAAFGEQQVLYGTDYPMWDAADELARLNALGLTPDTMEKILYKNIQVLLP